MILYRAIYFFITVDLGWSLQIEQINARLNFHNVGELSSLILMPDILMKSLCLTLEMFAAIRKTQLRISHLKLTIHH